MTCNTLNGVCQKCYGRNLATGNLVEIGEAVGVMAAQSIGEPGTQLTMRTFHSGGVAHGGDADITQGLPRVQELFEARNPKAKATIAEIDGKITKIKEEHGKYKISITNKLETKELIVDKLQMITESLADKIISAGITEVEIRNILTCNTVNGVCQKCYGRNLATGNLVEIGEAVGVMAAQSIGEPGTQLTMRTFHSGGVAHGGDADITQGLPRVQELFEVRNPKAKATIAEIDGVVSKIKEDHGKYKISITNKLETKEHITNYGSKLCVEKGMEVHCGDKLTEGAISPKELLNVTDPITTQEYILKEVQYTYRSQGVDISDKHIEIIARRMISKIRIVDGGDTNFLPGSLVNFREFTDGNRDAIIKGKTPALGKPILLGITKAALETDSFLSAASFQETTRILTDAAIKGKVDPLAGLKENVIIGKLIPAGTGSRCYRDVEYELKSEFVDEEPLEQLEEQFMG